MNRTRTLSKVLVVATLVGALAGVLVTETRAHAQFGMQIGIGVPSPVVATMTPIYYGGRANYWYGGRWMYRNGNAWNYYNNVPPYLYQRRMGYAPMYRHYGWGGYRGGWGGWHHHRW